MEFITKLWNEKRWLFWCLLPVVICVAIFVFFCKFANIIIPYLAQRDLGKAENTNQQLNQEIQQDTVNAEVAKAKAQAAEEKIKERTSEDISEDWYKTYKKPQ